jgi:hypothetical protein
MGMDRCVKCENMVDTDVDAAGDYLDAPPYEAGDYVCGSCLPSARNKDNTGEGIVGMDDPEVHLVHALRSIVEQAQKDGLSPIFIIGILELSKLRLSEEFISWGYDNFPPTSH